MKHGIYISAILLVLAGLSGTSYAAIPFFSVAKDTIRQVVIYFDANETGVDSCYRSNKEAIATLDSLLTGKLAMKYITALDVTTFVSPDGNESYNSSLIARRNNSLKELLRQCNLEIDGERIHLFSGGEDWTEFRKLAAADPNLPDREEVLMLVDYHKKDIARRKQLLRKLNRGAAYQYMLRHVFPELRRSVITVVGETPETVQEVEEEVLPEDLPEKPERESEKTQTCGIQLSEPEKTVESRTVLAVKNNLLYDLALAPNIEVEIPMGKKWSLNAEYKCPWWLNNKHEFCYQLLSGGMEGRYWLGNRQKRNRLTGHFIGLYAEGGIYDFQFHGDGYQGKYYGAAGMTYGYARQLARHFSLEFSLGIGYLTTEYKKYTPYEEDIVWTNSGRYNFIGPTKAKISLVWLITTRR